MPRKKPEPPPRRRRSAEEAREAILDAAEKRLVAQGPDGIRLQEVAADVGVSHPTVLHHFGTREGLVEAVVARALESLHADLLTAIGRSPKGPDQLHAILEACFEVLASKGHGRAFLWLSLAGYAPAMEALRVEKLAEAVHELRRQAFAQSKKRAPPFEDTFFTVLLPALALLSLSVTGGDAPDDALCSSARFRAWLARLLHRHLEAP